MSELADAVPSLQNALAVPGTFADLFPNTLDDDLLAVLVDAFAETQLDGWLADYSVNDFGTVTPDLSRAQTALVILYATCRILATEIRNRKTHVRYEAKGVVYENDQSAMLLVQMLKDLTERKKELRNQARTGDTASAFAMVDLYLAKDNTPYWNNWGSWPYVSWPTMVG